MAQKIDFVSLLHKSQEYISENYAAALSDRSKVVQLRSYIEKYLHDSGFEVEGMTFRELSDKLYSEMAEYSVLTKYLGRDEIEEININGWDDIAVTYTDGHIEKAKEHFYNPQHAVDVVKRLLHHSGMIIDNATPMSQGHLPGNTRITALKEPLVDDDRGISVSIRLLHPSRVDMKALVKGGNATQKMIDFLCMCLRYGISFVVAGATSSGKTTLLNALLTSIPDNKRIFTIESGSRELSLVKVKDGEVINNVVHTLSRPSDNPAYDITQEDLVVASLRFNPDIVVVGEMRDTEAYSAVEASLTGHTVKLFIRFALAKGVITYGLELMLKLMVIVQGVISKIMTASGIASSSSTALPQSIIDAIEDCGFWESIPLWAVTLIGGLFITVLSFIMIMSVYGRFFKIYMYSAIAPVPLSTFAGQPTENVGKTFLKSYCAVLLEGAIIVLACVIFSVFASSPPTVDTSAAAVTQVWSYVGELIFNMLVLVGSVKMADRIVREMMGL